MKVVSKLDEQGLLELFETARHDSREDEMQGIWQALHSLRLALARRLHLASWLSLWAVVWGGLCVHPLSSIAAPLCTTHDQ